MKRDEIPPSLSKDRSLLTNDEEKCKRSDFSREKVERLSIYRNYNKQRLELSTTGQLNAPNVVLQGSNLLIFSEVRQQHGVVKIDSVLRFSLSISVTCFLLL